jgi:hypothetical protein
VYKKNIFNKIFDNTNVESTSYKLRKLRFYKFVEKLHIDNGCNILDVGGTPSTWIGTGYENNVTLLNLNFNGRVAPFKYVEGNACKMTMFKFHEFDVVFSNSVIEHVGIPDDQKHFADEVQRVGLKYWVQTPNKYFPFELHLLFPYYQFLPKFIQRQIAVKWKYSHIYRNNKGDIARILDEALTLRLLTKSELRRLFPDASVIEEKFFCLPKSIMVYRD